MDKKEFLGILTEACERFGEVGPDDPPYNLLLTTADDGTMFRIQVAETKPSGTRATALQAGTVIAYLAANPGASSAAVARACAVPVPYVEILRSAIPAELIEQSEPEVHEPEVHAGLGHDAPAPAARPRRGRT